MGLKPLAIDLFCGLGGWTEGLLAEGYDVIGFDIERHVYGEYQYPAQLVIQDVRTLHGSQFRNATLIVASPPCQAYSYRAMPWKRAKALPPPDNELFETCFRIRREACEAAGRHIPLIVENVRGAQKWVGRARWNFGSYYLWGDVPALMPIGDARKGKGSGRTWFYQNGGNCRSASSQSRERKEWSARVAKIPLPLSRHIAATFKRNASMGLKSNSEWDGVCACGKTVADGVRCRFGATHEKKYDFPWETEQLERKMPWELQKTQTT